MQLHPNDFFWNPPLFHPAQFRGICDDLVPFLKGLSEASLAKYGFSTIKKMTDDAPDCFEKVAQAIIIKPYGDAFPIYADSHCDKTTFGKDCSHWLYRAWHDIVHVEVAGAFNLEGEIPVIDRQLVEMRIAGAMQDKCWIVYLDIMGQLLHEAKWGTFPENGRAFVEGAACRGLKWALAFNWS